ncbi:unnamed protein product [Merluccius merluccius]
MQVPLPHSAAAKHKDICGAVKDEALSPVRFFGFMLEPLAGKLWSDPVSQHSLLNIGKEESGIAMAPFPASRGANWHRREFLFLFPREKFHVT